MTRKSRSEFGLRTLATPLALLSPARRRLLQAESPVLILTDHGAGHHYWRHGLGLVEEKAAAGRTIRVEVPAARFAEIQRMVDTLEPIQQTDGRWRFEDPDGWRLVVEVVDGRAELVTYFRQGPAR